MRTGLNAFVHYVGPHWRTYETLRNLNERGRTINAIVSTEYTPCSPCSPFIASKPYAIKFRDTINPYGKDAWMLTQLEGINKSAMEKVYNTLIKRNKKQFYLDFCPFRFGRMACLADFSEAFKRVPSWTLCDYAISESPLVLWVRYEVLRECQSGLTAIRYYKAIGDKAKKLFNLPIYPYE